MGSPLGKYSDVAATVVGVGVILAWIVVHVLVIVLVAFGHAEPPATTLQALDYAGIAALGLILGQRATTNGASQIAQSANARLDAIGAPSAAAATASLAAGEPPRAPTNLP